jgi:hypothetical protein
MQHRTTFDTVQHVATQRIRLQTQRNALQRRSVPAVSEIFMVGDGATDMEARQVPTC